MHPRLTPIAALLLTLAPLPWAGNVVLGRLVSELAVLDFVESSMVP